MSVWGLEQAVIKHWVKNVIFMSEAAVVQHISSYLDAVALVNIWDM